MKLLKIIKNFLIDWVWQLPQNTVGLIYRSYIKNDITKTMYDESNHCYLIFNKYTGGVSLGKYVFIYYRYDNLSYTVMHETGHVIQSRILGPLYLIIVGLPSIIWATVHRKIVPNINYYSFPTEKWANKLIGI